jgi:glycosyltransferase involved in cell wall biosynthesis
MRVGIDGSCWVNRRGFGRFTRALVAAMAEQSADGPELRLLLDSASLQDPTLPPIPQGVEVDVVLVGAAPATAAAAEGSRSVRDILAMSRGARAARYDAFFFPASYSYFPVIGPPVVVTVHDAIAEALPELILPTRGDRLRWAVKQQLALRQATAVLTVSEASRQAVLRHLRVPEGRLHVINEAPDGRFRPTAPQEQAAVLARHGLAPDARFFLYVGGISPHKNLPVLIEAFSAVHDEAMLLLLVGEVQDDPFLSATDAVREAIKVSPARERIRLLGYVPDDDLPALYGAAVATAQPSLGEGFGLTAAESAACGTPVIASRDAALTELLGPAGTYADARSVPEWTAALSTLALDPARRAAAATASMALAATWSWDRAAGRTLDIVCRAARRE